MADMNFEDGPSYEDVRRYFRAERAGALQFGEHVRELQFVTDNETGVIVAPVMVAVFDFPDATLFVPEEAEDAIQVLVTPEHIEDENIAAIDRWRIHHGEPIDVRWAKLYIDSVKYGPVVFDGDAFMTHNEMAPAEPAICRELNADREGLKRLCEKFGRTEVAEPLCVGLDADGLHVRARFGLVRIPFDHTASDPDEAKRLVESMRQKIGAAE